ncbi:MAG: thioredoxin [Erysipelotrichaceae bacterium]|nr:thioredoxin [Erysipelotrichaceae bacterium]
MDIIKNKEEYDALLAGNPSVFVDFYADWCGPCKMAGPVLEEISKDYPDIKFVKVNVDDNPEIAQQYGVMSIPTMIAFKNGEQTATSLGFKPREELEAVVKAAQ